MSIILNVKVKAKQGRQGHIHLIPGLRKQRQAYLCRFKDSLVYRTSSRTPRATTQRNPMKKKKPRGGRKKSQG